jgi:hypothetical protein
MAGVQVGDNRLRSLGAAFGALTLLEELHVRLRAAAFGDGTC